MHLVIKERRYKAGYVVKEGYNLVGFEDQYLLINDGDLIEERGIVMAESAHWGAIKKHKPKSIFAHMFYTKTAYTPDGHYIGEPKIAHLLCVKKGIAPELAEPDNHVCSIGFSAKHNAWFGWSHRAIVGFKIGDKIFEADYGDDDTPCVEHGSKTIKTMKQAKQAAINFANYVS